MVDNPDYQTTEEGREFEKSIMQVLDVEKKDYPSYFGGFKVASGVEFTVSSPVDDSIRYGIFQEPEPHIMVEAVGAAVKAFEEWSYKPTSERAACFKMVLNTLKARRMYYAAMVTIASGMTRQDSLLEVDRLIEVIESLISEAESGIRTKPYGVWAIISAHNSCFASPVAYAVAAIIAGNTVVMNPSKTCPTPVYAFYTLCEKFGLPGGVLNLVVDRKEDEATEELANDMRVAGIVATGSGDRMEDLMFLQVDDDLKFINEIKGMNPAIVYRPSNMKEAVKNIVDSAFSFSGQRLYSCSKVIITADDRDKFVSVLTEQMKDIVIDDPVNDSSYAGPLITMEAAKKFKDLALENMPFTVAKAKPVSRELQDNYVSPIAVMGLDEENDLNFMDSGLPILNIKVVEGIDAAFEELEDTECGLSAGLFTKDNKVIDRFEKDVDVPMRYINSSSRGLVPAYCANLSSFSK